MPATAISAPVAARETAATGVADAASLADLVREIEAALARSAGARGVADALAPFLGDPALLKPADCVPAEGCYARNLLHAAADGSFSIWAMVWQPGQGSSIHDHSCWCVMGVHRGVLVEEGFTADGDAAWPARRTRCGAGTVRALEPGADDIHRIANAGAATAISIHVYGFDPTVVASSVGRTYAA